LGFTGDRCEVADPCGSEPCGKTAVCVNVPHKMKESYDLDYTCLCNMENDVDESGKNDFISKPRLQT
jgi:hypothetical protein